MKGELKVGEITLFKDKAIIAFKKEVEEKGPFRICFAGYKLNELGYAQGEERFFKLQAD